MTLRIGFLVVEIGYKANIFIIHNLVFLKPGVRIFQIVPESSGNMPNKPQIGAQY